MLWINILSTHAPRASVENLKGKPGNISYSIWQVEQAEVSGTDGYTINRRFLPGKVGYSLSYRFLPGKYGYILSRRSELAERVIPRPPFPTWQRWQFPQLLFSTWQSGLSPRPPIPTWQRWLFP
jgi:hypothetical protein